MATWGKDALEGVAASKRLDHRFGGEQTMPTNNSKAIRAFARGLEVIEVLNTQHNMSVCSLAGVANMPRATLLRILRTLEDAGWVYRHRISGDYRLASKVCLLGEHLVTTDRLIEAAGPIMHNLSDMLGCAANLAVCTGHDMRILESTLKDVCRNRRNRRISGNDHMLCSALGRAYLAFCPDMERHTILARVANPVEVSSNVHPEDEWIDSILASVRDNGYAMTKPGGCKRHADCKTLGHAIAVPVRPNGYVRATLSLAWYDQDTVPRAATRDLAPPLLEAASGICDEVRELEHVGDR
jgi:IclR family mhp operon transcriptional activator